MIKCPVCRATYKAADSLTCRRCGAELAALIHLHDRAVWHYHQAIAAFNHQDLVTALTQVQQAIALNAQRADFHAFAGQLWALQGDWQQAIAAWKTAQQLEPQLEPQRNSQQDSQPVNPQSMQAIDVLKLIAQLTNE